MFKLLKKSAANNGDGNPKPQKPPKPPKVPKAPKGGAAGGPKFGGGIAGIGLKMTLYITIVTLLAILLGAANFSLFNNEKNTHTFRFLDDVRVAKNYYQFSVTKLSEQLSAQLEIMRQNVGIQIPLRNKDQHLLLQRTSAIFEDLKKHSNVTHLFFNDEKRMNVLRVHQPSLFGDTIQRVPMLLAEQTGQTTTGMELSPTGVLSMRAAAPVHDNAGLSGYIEMGQDTDAIFANVRNVTNLESVLILDKQFLMRKDWEASMKKLGLAANWDQFPGVVISRASINIPPPDLMAVLIANNTGQAYSKIQVKDKTYYGDALDVKDVGGRKVGRLVLLRDTADYVSDTLATVVYLSMGFVVTIIVILVAVVSISRSNDKKLADAHRQIVDAQRQISEHEQEFEVMHAQHISELESERTKMEQVVADLQKSQQDLNLAAVVFDNCTEGIIITDPQTNILRVNESFTKITGYSEHDVLGKKAQLLRSSRHDATFFQEMWAMLLQHGNWQGEIWNCRKNGESYPEWLSLSAIQNEKRETIYYLGFFSDLTEKKITEARNQHLSNYDTLTDLPNRHMLEERLKQMIATAHQRRSVLALAHLNLDRFKSVVDSLGHPFGDKLLRGVADRLATYIRDSDMLSRFSGDEFAIVLSDVGNQHNASMVAKKLLSAFESPFVIEQQEIYLTCSIGIAMYPGNAENRDDMIQSANIAARHAREEGGDCFHFYASEMNEAASHRLTMENSLRRALDNEEFMLYYQPQLDLKSGAIVGVEALIRWQHPSRGIIFPDEYIPVLEETGLIVPVGEWALHVACAQLAEWREKGYQPLRMAVNLSARQFRQGDLLGVVSMLLEDMELTPDLLELEITESALLQDVSAAVTILNQFKDLGVSTAIDDFGTGYSSLSYLKQLPIAKIKIDRSFIKDIGTSHDDGSIANAVISLGHSLGMHVVAEGVETEDQLNYLRENGCDEMQGYYFSRPIPAEEFERFLQKRISLNSPRRAYRHDDEEEMIFEEKKSQHNDDVTDLEFS